MDAVQRSSGDAMHRPVALLCGAGHASRERAFTLLAKRFAIVGIRARGIYSLLDQNR